MSSIASTMKTIDERESVMSINANARIDYVLRFSQHAVLVIDDDTDLCTQIGNQFLGSLTREHNAAYVSLSSKLNDIQIRCRIIEQLFGNTLFDPEQVLSVNIIKLSENNDEVITVVIGNSEHMSLQLFHELCQLSEISKKLKKTINVVFLGSIDAGKMIADNSTLFDKKLSIIQGSTGQLLGVNSAVFKNKSVISIKNILKGCAVLVIFITIGVLMFVSDLWGNKEPLYNETDTDTNESYLVEQFVHVDSTVPEKKVLSSIKNLSPHVIATSEEVFHFLTENSPDNKINRETADIKVLELEADPELIDKEVVVEPVIESEKLKKSIYDINKSSDTNVLEVTYEKSTSKLYNFDELYFQSLSKGVVIQFASFGKIDGYRTFIASYPNVEFKGYLRSLNGVESHIVTSKVFNTNTEAKVDISNLPLELKARGPWIKSITAINNEIQLYQDGK